MRIVYNILIGVMVLGIIAAGAWRSHANREWTQRIEQTKSELQRIEREVAVRMALRDVEVSTRGYPLSIDPKWFEELPQNHLLLDGRPWLELASDAQEELHHPPDPVALSRSKAMFWYNPHTGRVRARVPAQPTEAASLALYNLVNRTALQAK